ncbi:hypothetical protein Lal_00039954, partial [Lupinus albus]
MSDSTEYANGTEPYMSSNYIFQIVHTNNLPFSSKRMEKILQESQVPEVHEKYHQIPKLYRKLSEVCQTR